jgi:hypothetical protein
MARYGGNRFVEILRLGEASEDASDGESTVWLRPFQVLHEIAGVDWCVGIGVVAALSKYPNVRNVALQINHLNWACDPVNRTTQFL